ncbi:hypothetical protein [Hufsiella ginkgonis]|uniref:Uncharacterized protein n=1 Tax=Hufsiella ginkgonis TaxID=2695274 RepID=A0A7K1Y433_9SPHI|nr:hypothetical protein [Hufsiella ginkgonis]MXV18002.1 hypothetical protein [Hufsiella ginkgonis]
MVAVKIEGDDKGLSVTLQDILTNIPNGKTLYWALLWIEASGDLGDESILEFENTVNHSVEGTLIEWEKLHVLSSKILQTIEILFIGCKNHNDIKRYKEDKDMYSTCDYTVELIDSSYWLVHSKDTEAIEHLKKALNGKEYAQ